MLSRLNPSNSTWVRMTSIKESISLFFFIVMPLSFFAGCSGGGGVSTEDLVAEMRRKKAQNKITNEVTATDNESGAITNNATDVKKSETATAKPNASAMNSGATTAGVTGKVETAVIANPSAAPTKTASDTTKTNDVVTPSGQPTDGLSKADTSSFVPVTSELQHRKIMVQNLKNIGDAIRKYQIRFQSFPPQTAGREDSLSWRVLILPQLGYQELFDKFDMEQPWDHPTNMAAAQSIPKDYQSPTSGGSKTCIVGVCGTNCAFSRPIGKVSKAGPFLSVIEEENQIKRILMMVEVPENLAVEWTKPDDFDFDLYRDCPPIPNRYSTGTLAIWADGQSNELNADLSLKKQRQLCDIFNSVRFERDNVSHEPSTIVDQTPVAGIEKPSATSKIDQANPSGFAVPEATHSQNTGGTSFSSPLANFQQSIDIMLATGRSNDAYELFLANLAVMDDDRWIDQVSWSPIAKRPILDIRYGLTIVEKRTGGGQRPTSIGMDDVAYDPLTEIEKKLHDVAGAPAVLLLQHLRQLSSNGDLGSWIQSASQDYIQLANGRRTANQGIRKKMLEKSGDDFPGVKIMNASDERVALDLAQREDLDFLAMIILTSTKRTGQDQNARQLIEFNLYDVQNRRLIGSAPEFTNDDYNSLKQFPLKENPLKRWTSKAFELIAQTVEKTPLPTLDVEMARNRLRTLVKQESTRVRAADLWEAKLYLNLGLISGVELQKVARSWLRDGENNKINDRDLENRIDAISSLLPKDWKAPPQDKVNRQEID